MRSSLIDRPHRAHAIVLAAAGMAFFSTFAFGTDTTIPLNYNFNGMVHPGEAGQPDALNGFRSISDRALLIDGAAGSFATVPIVGSTGLPYTIVQAANTLDIVHLGNRAVFWPYEASAPGTSPNLGIQPTWQTNADQTGPQATDVSSLALQMFANTAVGVLYQASDGGGVLAPAFDAVLTFTDASSVTVRLQAPDWFNTPAVPAALAGVASQTRLGGVAWNGTNSNDLAVTAPTTQKISVIEGVITVQKMITDGLGNHAGKTLSSITFQNAAYNGTFSRGYAIIAATVRGSAVFPPSGTASVTPNPAVYNTAAKLAVAVIPGSGTPNTISSVRVDGSSIGLSSMLALNDSGSSGDLTTGDGTWSLDVTIPSGAPAGPASLPFTITDAQSRTGTGVLAFSIVAPPAATDFGTLVSGPSTFSGNLNAGAVQWVKFTLASPIDGCSRSFLDIDTEGSSLTGGTTTNDTMIGLYTLNGNLVAFDDDDGTDFLSQLTFGAGNPARAAPGNGQAYNGRDGATLAAGVYYLAFASFPATFNTTQWNVTTTATGAGPVNINFNTGSVPPPTPVILAGPITNPANTHDYYLLNTGLDFCSAEAAAVAQGGHLATINDAAENEWVRVNVLGFDGADRRGWIGFNDAAVEGTFVWTNGEPAAFTNWSPGEPNNANNVEDYAEMLGSNGLWNDVPAAGAAAGDFAIVEVGSQPQTGACCHGSTCSITASAACNGALSRYAGNGTTCNAAGTTPCCRADYNQTHGAVEPTVQDIFDFLTGYFNQDPAADVNGTGTVTVQDIFDFLSAYFSGC